MEIPVTFTNRNGNKLFGMIFEPEQPLPTRTGIIISVNAVKYRLGTFRLHVLLSRRLSALGYTVFCFDPEGIGDSEGEFDYKLLIEHYFDIQMGKYSADLSDAIGYFVDRVPVQNLLLLGLCGGAISVLMEGARDSRVNGLILLNIPVLFEELKSRSGEVDNSLKITSSEKAQELLLHKLQKLARREFWRRFVRGQVNFGEEARLVKKSVQVLARKIFSKATQLFAKEPPRLDPVVPVSQNPLFNFHFQQSFFQVVADRKKILFVFAELDPWTWIFKSEFQDIVLTPGNAYEPYYSLKVLKAANHIYSSKDSKQELDFCIVEWLQLHYPVMREAA